MSFILSIDQGTTGTTAALIDAKKFRFVDKVNEEFKQHYPRPGDVEHDLLDIWRSTESTITKLLKKNRVSPNKIVAIGITNQRETTCAFDDKGKPLARAIVWQDRRTHLFCEELKNSGRAPLVKERTGLTIDPYFSGTKIRWLLKNNEKVSTARKNGTLHFGTIDTFLLFRLSGGTAFKTDVTNASRTLLMDLKSGMWDHDLLTIFDVPIETLPQICPTFHEFGKTKGLKFLPDGIPVTCLFGDQQSALFGQAGFKSGDVKCTYGTGSFILMNTGTEIIASNSGLLTTVAYGEGKTIHYALEGSCYITGAAVQWLRDNLKIIKKSSDIESLANKVKHLHEMEHILFLPFFTGIGSPHWKAEAKATITGLSRDSSEKHLARACLDGIAFSINDLVSAMKKDAGTQMKALRVDGGAVVNKTLLEIQASVLNCDIIRPKVIETTAYGAALGAAVGAGLFKIDDLTKLWKEDKTFKPKSDWLNFYLKKKSQWEIAIKRLYL